MNLPLEFGQPWALLLLAVLAPIGYLAWTTQAPLRGARWWVSTVVRVVLVVALVLSLADVRWSRYSDDLCVMFLVDGSRSTGSKALEQARKQIARELPQMRDDDRFAIIVFGQRPLLARPTSVRDDNFELKRIDPAVGDFTDIGRAVRFAVSQFRQGYQKRIVLLSDGNENLGNALEEVRAAAAAQVDVLTCPLVTGYENEIVVDSVVVPARARPDQPISLKTRIKASRAGQATVRVFRDGRAIAEGPVDLREGANLIDLPSDTISEPGFVRYEVLVEPAAGSDTLAVNNVGLAYTQVYGTPRVLYLEGQADHARRLQNALRSAAGRDKGGFMVDVGSMQAVPQTIEELARYDCIILSDVPAVAMNEGQMKLLESYVKQLGGGLVMIGGQQSLTTGGYLDTPVAEALPVDLHLDREKHLASLALVIVVDQSGSMTMPVGGGATKMDLANQACVNALQLLDEYDQAAVCMTDTAPKWVDGGLRPMTPSNKASLSSDVLRNRGGGGGIFVRSGIAAAYKELAQSDAQSRHIILFADATDSEQQDGCFALARSHLKGDYPVTLTSVGLGGPGDPHVGFLRMLAENHGGGRFYLTSNAKALPEIFTRDTYIVSRRAIVEVEKGFAAGRVASAEMIEEINWTAAPPLYGYVVTRPREGGEVLLVAKDGEPLLARWRYGLGKATVFASDAKDRWARDWVNWDGYDRFWAQVVRWTMRETTGSDIRTQTVTSGNMVEVIVDAVDSEGNFINGQMLSANVISPDPSEDPRSVTLHQSGPGRYTGRFEARATGSAYQVAVVDDKQDRRVDSVGAVISYPPEYRSMEPNLTLLQQVADTAGGRFVAGDLAGSFRRQEQQVSALRSIWTPLLVAGVCLLVLDVASRRLVWPSAVSRRDDGKSAAAETAGRVMSHLRKSRDKVRLRKDQMDELPVAPEARQPAAAGRAAPKQQPTDDETVVVLKRSRKKSG
ncbi:MAG: VWA domain-containing protein [Planctomycetes bacterium]|nr:VWA domain-containing protein [Planctomycetota bacterium]